MENLTKRERHIFQLNAYEYRAFIMRSFYYDNNKIEKRATDFDEWESDPDPDFDWDNYQYRIYRPLSAL
jgi:hypothetical protein